MTQITCRDLTIGYGSRIILKHLNFTVNEGDYLCIIGENLLRKVFSDAHNFNLL